MTPDPTKQYIVAFSGGKDSVATWLYLSRVLELPRIVCTFADTGHESDQTYGYLDSLVREHGLPLVKIEPILADMGADLNPTACCERLGLPATPQSLLESLTMERLAVLKRRFPGKQSRFCTTILKLRPMLRWMRKNCDTADTIRVTGERAAESAARAAKPEYEDDRLFGFPIWRPIHQWCWANVFAIHVRYGVPPNPLYMRGCSRVGCYPCIFANKRELAAMSRHDPEAFDRLGAMERRVAEATGKAYATFFSNTKVPARYRSQRDPVSGKMICTAGDVRRWATGEVEFRQEGLLPIDEWADEPLACESEYGLCE